MTMERRPKWPMSAYSASPPVTTRNRDPSATKPVKALSAKKRTAHTGFRAPNTLGSSAMWLRPSTARVTNHTTMMGPNSRPMVCVPRRCNENNPMRMTTAIGMIHPVSDGWATPRPSTADSTLIAGVMAPSP